jgi:hypothetical protein
MIAISAGGYYTVGLKANGTVVAVGSNKDTDDGRVTAKGWCDTGAWRDIVAISAGRTHTVGLKSDGTVVSVGKIGGTNYWSDIIMISAGFDFTIGLKSDGTVVTTSDEDRDEINTWSDIIAISAGFRCTMGLKSNGTVVIKISEFGREFDVSNWYNIGTASPEGLQLQKQRTEQKLQEENESLQIKMQRNKEFFEAGKGFPNCWHCGGKLKTGFSGTWMNSKCKSCKKRNNECFLCGGYVDHGWNGDGFLTSKCDKCKVSFSDFRYWSIAKHANN